MANRLAQETSPYLLQHKDNPVDWYPWGAEAFEKALSEDKPVFLSVGYSSCHWCHVMEHESFEDFEVASVLNRGFVSVKVDREERPDVDETYMTAVQLQSGRGGWPMTVLMTPEKEPFFAGTYFPKNHFLSALRQVDEMWRTRRPEVVEAAQEFAGSLRAAIHRPGPKAFRTLHAAFIEEQFRAIASDFDPKHGGFGAAPKFPPHSALSFLLSFAQSPLMDTELRRRAREIALFTLEKMVLGGIHDHVGGGFHRYSTDEEWLVPHFEKMLYDNALMLENLARAGKLEDERAGLFNEAARGIVSWLREEMALETSTPQPRGVLLASALDADSEGEEGKFYVWTLDEIRDVLGDGAEAFTQAYGITAEGNYLDEATRIRTGANIPHPRLPIGGFEKELIEFQKARKRRERPLRDDKALVGWNGLAVAGLAEANEEELVSSILSALEEKWNEEAGLMHQVAQGTRSGKAYLDDLAGLMWGAVKADRTALAERALDEARAFQDETTGDCWSTSPAHEQLFGRSKPVFDQPIPSANALIARTLIQLGRLEEARRIIEANLGWIERAPGATEAMLLAALELLEATHDEPSRPEPVLKPGQIVSARLESEVLKDGQGAVILTMREGYHVNTNRPPANWLIPTEIRFEGVTAEVEYPDGVNDRYEGTVRIPFRIVSHGEFEITVSAQPCSETECLAPVELKLGGRAEVR